MGRRPQLAYVLGASLALWQVLLICAVLAAGALTAVRARVRPTLPLAVPLPAVVVGGAMLLLLAADLWYQPLWAFAAWTFWTPKAHALAAMNGLDAG